TATITANGTFGGNVTLGSASGAVTVGVAGVDISCNNVGNLTIVSTNGISLAGANTSATAGAGGNVIVTTGSSANAALLDAGPINSSGTSSGGLVLLVNSAAYISSNNLNV